MPTLAIYKKIFFFIFASDILKEPPHIHFSYFKMKNRIIDKISFKSKGKITIYMTDGRIIILPLNNFPSLKKLPLKRRKKYTILTTNGDEVDRGIMFDRTILFETKDFLSGKEIFA